MEFLYCRPQPAYLIIETVHDAPWILPGLQGQVGRRVAEICDIHDILYDGTRLSEPPGGWQLLMNALGFAEITTRATGERRFGLVFGGWRTITMSLPQNFPEPLAGLSGVSIPGIIAYGRDPIPQHQLYGDPRVRFYSSGGDNPPVAIAIYDVANDRLIMPPVEEIGRLLGAVLQRGTQGLPPPP